MAGLSPRFFSLLVVLLALGAFDLSTLLLLDSTTNGVGIGIRGAVALPVGNEALGLSVYPSKPRIGIVIKTNANLGGKEISAGSVPAAKRRGAFDERSIGSGVTLPLRRVDHSTAANPLMVSSSVYT